MGSPTDFLHQTLLGDAWDNAELAAVVFDDDRNFITMNHAYCRLTGYDRVELCKLRAGRDVVADDETRREFERSLEADARGRFGSGTIRRKDGTTVPVTWLTIKTRVSSLPYFVGVVWPTDDAPARD